MAWVGSYRANECPKCGEYFPADLNGCPFCAVPVNRTSKSAKPIRPGDDYDD